jgi:hypothetical protein
MKKENAGIIVAILAMLGMLLLLLLVASYSSENQILKTELATCKTKLELEKGLREGFYICLYIYDMDLECLSILGIKHQGTFQEEKISTNPDIWAYKFETTHEQKTIFIPASDRVLLIPSAHHLDQAGLPDHKMIQYEDYLKLKEKK